MLVHFIGGPAHGRSEAIKDPHPVWRMAELKRLPGFAGLEFKGDHLAAEVPYIEHTYRITKRTARYAVAEWEAPPVQVRFVVELEFDPFDTETQNTLYRFVMERREATRHHDVKVVAADTYYAEKITLTLVTTVEGPNDPVALQLAAEKVQHYLDAELPAGSKQTIQQSAAETATA